MMNSGAGGCIGILCLETLAPEAIVLGPDGLTSLVSGAADIVEAPTFGAANNK